MNKKLILTSFVALGFACPAMAEPTNTSSTFPDASQNEYMQEDYTYEGAATSTNMAGVYQNNATVYANAKYHDVVYALAAGKYLPANSETPIDCDQNGYFCAGDDNGVNYSSSAQGLTQCPTGYGNSGTGASANTDCYRTCTNNDVAHSTGTVNGGVYYNGTDGDGTKTCEPTDCVNGWHVKPGFNLIEALGTTGNPQVGAALNNSGNYDAFPYHDQSFYGLTERNTWASAYGNKIIYGQSRCSTQQGDDNDYSWTNPTILSNLTDETGQEGARYCYCNVTGYKADSSSVLQSLNTSWIFYSHADDATYCANNCALACAGTYKGIGSTSGLSRFRAALLGVVEPTIASCAANTINISWDGATSASVSANDAGSVTYGGDIRTPQSAIHVPGKVFDGWEFSTTAPVSPVTE